MRKYYQIFLIYTVLSLAWPVLFLNKVFFIFMLFLVFLNYKKTKIETYSPIIVTLIFSYGAVVALFYEFSLSLLMQLYVFPLTYFLFFYVRSYRINMNVLVVKAGIYLSLLTLLMAFSKINDIGPIVNLFAKYSAVSSGEREVFTEQASDFFRLGGLPVLFVSFSVTFSSLLNKVSLKTLVILFLISTVIIISTSRATIACCLIFVMYKLCVRYKNLIPAFLIVTLYFLFDFSGVIFNVFDSNELGNSIKIRSAQSFLTWADNIHIFWGNGLASYFYSSGRGYEVAQTEITLFDNIRYFGVIFTLLLYLVLLFPSSRFLPRFTSDGFIIFILYLSMSLTNPVLFNSFGSIVVLWYWHNVISRDSQLE